MSRGLGALQRRILDALMAVQPGPEYVVAAELCETVTGKLRPFDRSTLVSFRRALHSLERRGLVRLGSQGLYAYRAEVLTVWLPTWSGPKPFMGKPSYKPTRAARLRENVSVAFRENASEGNT